MQQYLERKRRSVFLVSFGPRDEQNISKAHMLERHYLPRDIVLMDFVFVFQRALKDCYNISSKRMFSKQHFFLTLYYTGIGVWNETNLVYRRNTRGI